MTVTVSPLLKYAKLFVINAVGLKAQTRRNHSELFSVFQSCRAAVGIKQHPDVSLHLEHG